MKYSSDLNLAEGLCIRTSFHFPVSGLYLLNGFDFYFDLLWMAWRWKPAIIRVCSFIYWKMKFGYCWPWGRAFAHCFKPQGGIVVRTVRTQRGAFAAFPEQNDKCAGRDGHEPLHSSSHFSSRELEAIVFTSENYHNITVESTKEI